MMKLVKQLANQPETMVTVTRTMKMRKRNAKCKIVNKWGRGRHIAVRMAVTMTDGEMALGTELDWTGLDWG